MNVTPTRRTHRRPTPPRGSGRRLLRTLSGMCAGGLVVLAVVLVVARLIAGSTALPGPTGSTLGGHIAFAVAAVTGQVFVDREDSPRSTAVAGVIVAMVLAVLWIWWWR